MNHIANYKESLLINRREVVDLMAEHTGETKKICKKMLDAFCDVAVEQLQYGVSINLYGLGKFDVSNTKERTFKSGLTGNTVVKPPHKKIVFRPAGCLLNEE